MLIPSFYPQVGGAERQLAALLPFLREQGVQPFVITRRLSETPPTEQLEGVQIIRPRTYGHIFLFLLSSLVYLIQHRHEWDLVHVHTADSPALVGATTHWALGKPVIMKVTRSGPNSSLDRQQHSLLGKVRLGYLRKWVDGFVVVNREIASDLLDIGIDKERLFTIPNGVDIDQFQPISETQRTQMRQELGLQDALAVIYVGRLIPRKRVSELIEIWPTLLQSVPNAMLLVVGDGPQQAELHSTVQRQGLTNNVRFYGNREQKEIIPLLQASDCFVLPSESEGVSNALLEAMATGLAPVVSCAEGNLEVVQDGNNGYVFDQPEALLPQLVQCLSHEALRRRLGQNARQTIVERFSLSHVASQLVTLYHTLSSNTMQ